MKKTLSILLISLVLLTTMLGITAFGATSVTVIADEDWDIATYDAGKLYNYDVADPEQSGYYFNVAFNSTAKVATISLGSWPTGKDKVVIPAKVIYHDQTYDIRTSGTLFGLNNTTVKTLIISEGVTIIGVGAFRLAKGVTSLRLPSTLTEIDSLGFNGLELMEGELVIPYGVTKIGNAAFSGWKKITSMVFPETITNFGDGMFNGNSVLANLVLNIPLTKISESMFSGTLALTTFVIPDTIVGDIPRLSFYNSGISGAQVLPAGVTSITGNAFQRCNNLTKITMKGNVATISGTAFNDSTKLKTFVFEGSVAPVINGSGTIINQSGITVYYPANGTGYNSTFIALFPAGTVFIPVTGANITGITHDASGYTVSYRIGLGFDDNDQQIESSVNFIALFNDEILVAVKSVDATLESIVFTTEQMVTGVKAFVWKDTALLIPLCASAERLYE